MGRGGCCEGVCVHEGAVFARKWEAGACGGMGVGWEGGWVMW